MADASLQSSTSLMNISVLESQNGTDTPFLQRYRTIGLAVNIVGLLANITALVIVVRSSRISQGRKLLLLNLIMSDTIMVFGSSVHLVERSISKIGEANCVVLVNILIISVLSSYLITLQLSALNFLAAYKIFQYRIFATWKKTSFTLSISWILSISISLFSVGFDFTRRQTCSPTIVISRHGLGVIVTPMILSFLGIITFNSYTFMKVKKSRQFGPKIGKNNQHSETCGRDSVNTNRLNSKTYEFKTENQFGTAGKHRFHLSLKEITPDSPVASCKSPDKNLDVSPCSDFSKLRNHGDWTCELVPKSNTFVFQKYQYSPNQCTRQSSSPGLTSNTSESQIPSSSSRRRRHMLVHYKCCSQFDKTRRTILIITTYSCILSIPILTYLLCIISNVVEDPKDMLRKTLGLSVSLLATIKPCINPFFYVLNLVDLLQVAKRLKQCPCCCPQQQ